MLTDDYQRTVTLLLRLVPLVFASDAFAMKGGTAINLYLSAMPRLSVDIDLTFLPLGLPREDALRAITAELDGIRTRATRAGLTVREPGSLSGQDAQLLVSNSDVEVKVEVNQVFRGSVLPPRLVDLHPVAAEVFGVDAPARLLAPAEVYAGKTLAALDRQHPRDLFDMWKKNKTAEVTADDLDVFAIYLAGHNRTPHELLAGQDKPLDVLYESALAGMTTDPLPPLSELLDTRDRLRSDVRERMSTQARAFLLGFFNLAPDWTLLPFPVAAELPALQWKLRNLAVFQRQRPDDFTRHLDQLTQALD